MKGKVTRVVRRLKITTQKIVPLATEAVEKHKAIARNPKGGVIELTPHQINKELVKFLEDLGAKLEFVPTEGKRGRVEIDGVKVKVLPISTTNYDNGAFIEIQESSTDSFENTLKLMSFLEKKGIDIDKECIWVAEHNEEKACLFYTKKQKAA